MKKIFSVILGLVLVITGTFAFSACKESTKDAIIGKWSAVKITMKQGDKEYSLTKEEAEQLDTSNSSDMETMIKASLATNLTATAEFKKDGTVIYTAAGAEGNEDSTGTYTVDGNKIYIDIAETDLKTTATLKDGKLTLNYEINEVEITMEFEKTK
jgi:hypothetical protein